MLTEKIQLVMLVEVRDWRNGATHEFPSPGPADGG